MGKDTASEFAKFCRRLRVQAGLKQREVAAIAGIASSTYGNLESSQYKPIRRERAERLADHYRLSKVDRAAFLAAWDRCPQNPIVEKLKVKWNRRNAMRAKLKNYDLILLSLLEMLIVMLPRWPKPVCYCEFGGGTAGDPTRNCEICCALEAVGVAGGYSGNEYATVMELSKIRRELTTKMIASGTLKGPP